MQLTAKQYSDLMTDLDKKASGRKEDLRRASRQTLQARMTISVISDTAPPQDLPVTVKNISTRGIGMLSKTGMARGTQFIVSMPREDGPPARILCTVAHATQDTANLFSVGAEFTCLAPSAKPQEENTPEQDAELQRIRNSMFGN